MGSPLLDFTGQAADGIEAAGGGKYNLADCIDEGNREGGSENF